MPRCDGNLVIQGEHAECIWLFPFHDTPLTYSSKVNLINIAALISMGEYGISLEWLCFKGLQHQSTVLAIFANPAQWCVIVDGSSDTNL